jgi:hypothetical protein
MVAAAFGQRPSGTIPSFAVAMPASVSPPSESPLPISDFVDFPPKDEIVERLRAVDESPRLAGLYDTIGERLAAKTYERSASAFILIEMLYDFEEVVGSDMSYLLPRSIYTLTGDRDLALSALGAFNEIKDAIVLQAPRVSPPPASPPPLPAPAAAMTVGAARPTTGTDPMMHKLQLAQKTLVDLGLTTRVSIDLAMRRPSRDRVNRTLQDITALRTAMRRFEELLSQAELQVLEAAGVLWEGTSEPNGPAEE